MINRIIVENPMSTERNERNLRTQRDNDSRDREHSDSELTDISLVIQSRFPERADYDQNSHIYKKSYVHPNGYPIGVTACKGLVTPIDPGEIDPPIDPRPPVDPRHDDDPPDGPVHPLGHHTQRKIRQQVPENIVAWHWRLERSDGEVVDRAKRSASMGPEAC